MNVRRISSANVGLSRVPLGPPHEINAKQNEPKRGRRSCMKFRRKERATFLF